MIDFSQLIEPTVEILRRAEEPVSIKEIDERLMEKLNISPGDRKKQHKGGNQTEFSYRAAWARTPACFWDARYRIRIPGGYWTSHRQTGRGSTMRL